MISSLWFQRTLALLAVTTALTLDPRAQDTAQVQQPPAVFNPALYADELRHPIFFAVLEGLYRDGVSTELVVKILELDPVTKYPTNFVWACPICLPVIDALDVYRARPMFRGRKGASDTFGPGLSPELTQVIQHGSVSARQDAISKLVEGWIHKWMEQHRLTPEEKSKLQLLMEEGRKQGMMLLEAYRSLGGSYGTMQKCPSCEAGNGACKRE